MTVSTAIADSPLRQACTRISGVQAGGLAAHLAWRLRDFATNRHE